MKSNFFVCFVQYTSIFTRNVRSVSSPIGWHCATQKCMGLTLYVGTNKVNQGFYVSFFLTFSAGEALKFDDSPTTYAAKKENVDQVLQFMASQRIKMRQISSKGKQKSDKKFEVFCILALNLWIIWSACWLN